MTVRRYHPTVRIEDRDKHDVAIVQMIPADDGIMVRWEDHEAEVERLEALLKGRASKLVALAAALQQSEVELVKLKAEKCPECGATQGHKMSCGRQY